MYRTQLFDEKDLTNVKQIQNGYQVQALGNYLGQPASKAPAKVNWPKPEANISETPDLFRYLSFMLAFAHPQASKKSLLERFARIGIVPGEPFTTDNLSAEQRKALEAGIADGKAEFAAFKKDKVDTHAVIPAQQRPIGLSVMPHLEFQEGTGTSSHLPVFKG